MIYIVLNPTQSIRPVDIFEEESEARTFAAERGFTVESWESHEAARNAGYEIEEVEEEELGDY